MAAAGYLGGGGGGAGVPITTEGLGRCPYKRCVSVLSSFAVLCLAGTHMPSWFWWCILHNRYLLLSDLWFRVRLPGRVCRTFWPWLAGLVMGDSYYEGPVKKYVDDYYCIRSSNDNDLAEPVGKCVSK